MQPQTRATLVTLVEEHCSNVVRAAVSVQRHCKRARLVLHDDSTSTSSTSTSTSRRRVHAADINMALRLLGSEKLYAVGVAVVDHDESSSPHNNTAVVHLEDFLRHQTEQMPAAPSEVGIRMHWLAVDGMQPQIPQNPTPFLFPTVSAMTATHDDDLVTLEDQESATGGSGLQVQQLQASLLSEELQLYFRRVTLAMERGSLTADNRQQQDAVLLSVSRDPGLQELVPFLVRYCQQELFRHVNNAEHCRTLVRLAAALLQNPNLHLELHLHELLPALITCVVAKRLAPTQNHWALRREAAAALVRACTMFGEEYSTLKARVLRTLCDAMAPNKSLASRYGGTVAIALFGAKAVDAFLLPTVLECWREWERALETSTNKRFDILMCQRATLDALTVFWQNSTLEEKAERLDAVEVEDVLRDRWVPFQGDATQHATLFI